MKITFVLPAVTLNGGIRVVAIYAERLKRRGHEVDVVAPPLHIRLRRKVKSFVLARGWPSARLESSYFDRSGVTPRILDSYRPVSDVDVGDADVVVATFYDTAHWVKQLSARKGAKAIFIQNYEVEDGQSNPMLDASWRMGMHKIVISKWMVELSRDKFGDTRLSHVPNSVDLTQFNAPPRDKQGVPTVGLLYSKSWFKGCRTSLSALKLMAARLPSLRLISFGAEHPGPAALRLPAYSEFHYRPQQNLLRELYGRCDVWMCGSNREGFHLPPLEAMACRCPVVSTRVGGPLDTIEEGVNGHLVEIGDVPGLADRLLQVLSLPSADWKRMSDAAYRTATGFTWDDATDLFERALEFTIERNKRGELNDKCALRV
jgi:glycosyltransferase involved in cell wall biosynthesis